MQLAGVALCRLGDARDVAKTDMQPRRHVQSGVERFDDAVNPVIRQDAACVDHTHNHGFRTLRGGVLNAQVAETDVGLAPVKAQLAEAPVGTPVDDSLRGFCGELIMGVAEVQQIWVLDFHVTPPVPSPHVPTMSLPRQQKAARSAMCGRPTG